MNDNHSWCASPSAPPSGPGDALRDGMHVGAPCSLHLDTERRLTLMRFHTALHVFNTVMLRAFDGWITGVRMDPARSHIDFRVNYMPEMVRRIEEKGEDGRVRVVAIAGFEAQACGGTHVRDPGAVGRIRIAKVDNKGKQNRRFYLELGE